MFNATILLAGLVLHAATGEMGGTPRTAGAANFEVEVASAGQTANQTLQITIDDESGLTVTSVAPNTGPPIGGTVVTITGIGFFFEDVSVTFDGNAAIGVTVISSTSVTAVTPAHVSGTVDIVVTRPDTQVDTLVGGFTYGPLSVKSLSGVVGSTEGGTVLEIAGAGFESGAVASFGGVDATSTVFNSVWSLTVTVPPHVAGLVDVRVTNPSTLATTLRNAFAYLPTPGSTSITADTPAHVSDTVDVVVTHPETQVGTLVGGFADGRLLVKSLSRDVGSSSGGTVLEITGEGFLGGAVASFGGVDASSTVFNSSSSLTVSVPPHAAGLIDVTVTNPSTQAATVTNGFDFLPAPTVTYISHDFEDGTFGDFTTNFAKPKVQDWHIPGTESETYGHPFPLSVSGTFSVRARKGANSAGSSNLVHKRAGLAPTNPPLEPTGVYQRWYQYIPQQSLDMAANDHAQIKFLLNRGGPGGWLMGILGAQASGTYRDEVVMQMDACGTFLPASTGLVVKANPSRTGFRHPPNEWVEFQTWFFHDGTNGRARLWINGKEMFDVTDACLGTSDAPGEFDWVTGVAYVQGNTTGLPTYVYVDDAAMANGYIEPVTVP